jgi:hypothetical protein
MLRYGVNAVSILGKRRSLCGLMGRARSGGGKEKVGGGDSGGGGGGDGLR